VEAWHRSDVIFALVAPSIAPAAPQKPKHALVVPFQSIGKITFGINESKAFGVWSKPVGHVLVTVGLLAGAAALSAVATTSITLRTAGLPPPTPPTPTPT
jgi:hypothetical protein